MFHQNPVICDRSFAKLMIWLSRVEEEKAINRALNGSGIPVPTSNNSNLDSNRQKSPPPAPVSRCCTEARRYEVLTESSGYQSFLPSWEPTIGEFRFSLHTTSSPSLIDPPTHRKARSSRRQSILSVPHKHHSHIPLFLQSCLKTFPLLWQLIKACCRRNECYQQHPFQTTLSHRKKIWKRDPEKVPTVRESSTNIFRPPAPHPAQYQVAKHCPAIFKYSPNLNSLEFASVAEKHAI